MLVVLQWQFPKPWQGDQCERHHRAVSFITRFFGEATGAHVEATIACSPSTQERPQFVSAHGAAPMLHLDEDPRLLKTKPVG